MQIPGSNLATTQHFVGLAERGIAKMAQLRQDEGIRRFTAGDFETDGLAALEERTDIGQGLKLLGLERHDHPPMMPGSRPPSGSCHVGNTDPLQAHVALEKAMAWRVTSACVTLSYMWSSGA